MKKTIVGSIILILVTAVAMSTLSVLAETDDVTYIRGMSGDRVTEIQQALKSMGYNITVVNGEYTEETQWAVASFQKLNGLEVTGNADPETQRIILSVDAIPVPTPKPEYKGWNVSKEGKYRMRPFTLHKNQVNIEIINYETGKTVYDQWIELISSDIEDGLVKDGFRIAGKRLSDSPVVEFSEVSEGKIELDICYELSVGTPFSTKEQIMKITPHQTIDINE